MLFAVGAWGLPARHGCGRESARAGPRWRIMTAGAVLPSLQMFCLLRALRRAVSSDTVPVLSVLRGGPGDEPQNGHLRYRNIFPVRRFQSKVLYNRTVFV